jgi:transketolase
VELVEGTAVTLIATGLMVAESIRAAESLEAEGVSARVIDMHTVRPLDREAIARAARETGAIVVSEEHLVDGGLGVRVAQVVAETHPVPMEFVGIQNTYAESATPAELLDKYGLIARDVAAAARRVLQRKRS